jgi:hypothetical protein
LATKRNRFENGVANASSVTISNSDDTGDDAFSVVNAATSGTIHYNGTIVAHGAQSALFSNATTNNPCIVGFSDSAATDFAASVYIYLTGYPSADVQFGIRTQTSGAVAGEKAYINTAGKLQLVQPNGTVRVQSTGTAMPLNTWLRWDFWGTGLNSASTVLSTAFAPMDSSTDTDSITTGTITTTVDVAEVRFGKNGAITVADWYFDDVRANIGTGTRLSVSQEYLTDSDSGTFSDSDSTHTVDDVTDTGILTEGTAVLTRSGSGPAIPPKDRVRFQVDWDGDGFEHPIDDVTDYVRGPVSCSFGRSEPTAMSTVTAGSGSVSLANVPGPLGARFSPRNALSPLYGKIKPARPVLWDRLIQGQLRTIFRGQTDASPINPDVDSMLVSLRLIDTLATFRGKNITTGLHQGIWPGDAINYVLDAVGWTGGRDIDRGATIFPFWWADGTDALEALQQIVASEGCPALLAVNANGDMSFRGRHHRVTEPRSTTSQGTWRGNADAAEPIMAPGFGYDDAWSSVINTCSLDVEERAIGLDTHVWTSDEVVGLEPNEGRTFIVSTSDPFTDAVAPREGLDYELLTGSVDNITLSRTSGASTSITITAGDDGVSIRSLKLYAKPVPVKRTRRIEVNDQDSADVYGEQGLPSGMEPVWANVYDAKAILETAVADRAEPLTQLRVRFVCGVGDSTRLNLVTGYDISDRITVVEPVTATEGDFFIESISHDMTFAGDHVLTFGLEAAPPAGPAPFVLGTSVLGTGVLSL